ncbi:MAG: Type 1 glutamine amidotransferase-like domain-containing protein [Bacilli bacterium]|nr:Type 1 glutamine amidotransferase-like domain-containing protein [Bacilli bacterium]
MTKKIVAIGGGENGREIENNQFLPYETKSIDEEIVSLTNKKKPNYLFIVHSQDSLEIQDSYFQTMKKIYGDIFKCNCKDLKSNELDNSEMVKEKIDWADIIYEGGGDTDLMISLWKKTGFDKVLYNAWKDGKVISGISAGAVCWFNACNSDSETSTEEFGVVNCLNWFDLFITPHCNEEGRYESTKEQIKENGKVALMLSNKAALEIIDDKYRIIFSDYDIGEKPFAIKAYWDNGVYKEKSFTSTDEFLPIEELLSKDI